MAVCNKLTIKMATKEELNRLVGKVLSDEAFRKEFIEDPVAAAKKEGIDLTPDQAEVLKSIDTASMSEVVEKVASKTCVARYGV